MSWSTTMRGSLALVTLVVACGGERSPSASRPGSAAATAGSGSGGASVAAAPVELRFSGMCDASGGVALDAHHFVVADDEDNVLRVFDVRTGGAPVATLDTSPALGLPAKKSGPPETDLEASTRLGDRVLWLTSHGRNKNAKAQPARLRFFATNAPTDPTTLAVHGEPYAGLLDALLADEALAPLGLAAAAELAPKAPGGLNIEGLSSTDEGHVLLGLRNPVPDGRAIVIPLLNPLEVVDGKAAPRFGPVRRLATGGLGVRAMSKVSGGYLVVVGSTASGGASRLLHWDGADAVRPLDAILDSTNPEAIVSFAQAGGDDRILLLSDDGERPIDGVVCKDLSDARQKSFRARWLTLPPA
jgi:hypothetical protein